LRFEQNTANISGGAISVSKFLNITVELKNTTFISNNARMCGGAFYSDLSGNIEFINTDL
jgi:predicted outer membrane repeat protein